MVGCIRKNKKAVTKRWLKVRQKKESRIFYLFNGRFIYLTVCISYFLAFRGKLIIA